MQDWTFLLGVSTHQANGTSIFDVRVSHPEAPTNSVYAAPAEMYAAHEKQKINNYNHRITQIENGTLPHCASQQLEALDPKP